VGLRNASSGSSGCSEIGGNCVEIEAGGEPPDNRHRTPARCGFFASKGDLNAVTR
jgi:hypothetical protein